MGAGGIMLQGVCIDSGQSTMLHKGKSYYLFPNGLHHYYVSNFPDQEAHMGCFQALLFQIVEKEEWPQEPVKLPISLDPKKIYRAKLIWRDPGYKMVELKEYFLKRRKTHADFYKDVNLKKLCGCFPIHWFADFVEVKQGENVRGMAENDSIFDENVPKFIYYEQLSLFDLE